MTKFFKSDSFERIYHDILFALDTEPEFTPSPRGIKSKEITNLSFELTDPRNRIIWNQARDTNYIFATKFFAWMINGSSDFSYVASSNKKAKDFVDAPKDSKAMPDNFSTAYGPRIVKQMPYIIDELLRDQDSRRCVIHILNEGDLDMLGTETKAEYPCTSTLTFFIRDSKLHMYTHMRSNNCVLTLVYDVFNFTMLQEWLLNKLNSIQQLDLSLGSYHHNIASAHFFESEQELVNKILVDPSIGFAMKQ